MGDDLMRRLRAADSVRPEALALPELADLEAGWPAREATAATRRAPRKRWTGGFLSLSLAALVATGSAAATLTVVTGDPLGRVESVAVAPAAGTERIASVRAEDPDGGPPWTVKVGRAEPGLVCLNVGQVQGGQLGIRGLDGRFRTSAVGGADQCAVPPKNGAMLANARTFVGQTQAEATSVIYGIAAPDMRELRIVYPDGASKRLALDETRAFVVARRGTITHTSPSLWWKTDPGAPGGGMSFGDDEAARRRLGVLFKPPTPYPLDPAKAMR